MSNTDELKARVDALTKQLGHLTAGSGSSELKRKIERVRDQVEELRAENERVSRDNEALRTTLTNLVSSIEGSALSDLLDGLKMANREIDVVLRESARSSVLSDLQGKGRLSVVEHRSETAVQAEAAEMAERLDKGPYEGDSRRFTQTPSRSNPETGWPNPRDK